MVPSSRTVPPMVENIPEEIKTLPQWCMWIRKERQNGTYTKIPYQTNTRQASSTDRDTWNTLDNVLKAYNNNKKKFSGIGFFFSEETGIMGIDLDHVKNQDTGECNPEALKILKLLNSYTEISPSGTGFHVYVKGKVPGKRRRVGNYEMYTGARWNEDKGKLLEGRYFTVTGNRVKDYPATINDAQEAIDTLYKQWFPGEEKQKQETIRTQPGTQSEKQTTVQMQTGSKLSDSEIIEIASRASNSQKFNKLYKGISEGYPSQSEADLAFCSMLAFYTQDREQIERIFRDSGLYREEKPDDYRKRTIETALNGLTETYNPEKASGRPEHTNENKKTRKEQPPDLEENTDEGEEEAAEDRIQKYPEHIREAAYLILKEGDAFDFAMKTWSCLHVGDEITGQSCLCAFAATYILNSHGLHVKPSGESGKGKSDCIESALPLLPSHKYITGSLSSKALFYDKSLKNGLIVYCDDARLSTEQIDTIKQSTSDYQKQTEHRTVKKQEFFKGRIPARTTWLISSVDGFDDDQLANRFILPDVDGSPEQDQRVLEHLKKMESHMYSYDDDAVQICRCIFDILDKELYRISVPFTDAILWRNPENRRNFSKFLDVIRSVTLFKIFQRECFEGVYLSTVEDYERALTIYTGTAENNATNLTEKELQTLRVIAGKNTYTNEGFVKTRGETTVSDLRHALKVSQGRVHQILHGKDGRGGMLAKVPYLEAFRVNDTVENGDMKRTHTKNIYVYTGKMLGFELYDSVAFLDKNRVLEATEQTKKAMLEEKGIPCHYYPITPLLPHYYPGGVIAQHDTLDVDNNNNSNYYPKIVIKSIFTPSPRHCVNTVDDQNTTSFSNSLSCKTGKRVIRGNSMSTDAEVAITSPGNSEVMVGNSMSNNVDTDNLAKIKELKFLRTDLETYCMTYIRKHGGIENTGGMVESFIRENPGFRNSWSFDIILKETEKICKKTSRWIEKTTVSDVAITQHGISISDLRVELTDRIRKQILPDLSITCSNPDEETIRHSRIRNRELHPGEDEELFKLANEIIEKIVPIPYDSKKSKLDLSSVFVHALIRNKDSAIYRKIMNGEKLEVRNDITDFLGLFKKSDEITVREIEEIARIQEMGL